MPSELPILNWQRQAERRLLLGKTGKVVTWTALTPNPAEPHMTGIIVLVELENGDTITAPLTDTVFFRIETGMQVKAVWRRMYTSGRAGLIEYGIKLCPLEKA
jgi:uncharacterized OB-fold protein